MPTPHIAAQPGDFADVVLLPGDPRRAKYLADNFLQSAVCVNTVRNCFGYTGYYNGKRVSVMASGMGMASLSIYVTELLRDYGVKKVIRIGSCGSTYYPQVKMGDIVCATAGGTDSNINRLRFNNYDLPAVADFELLTLANKYAIQEVGAERVHTGKMFSTDHFYNPDPHLYELLRKWKFYGIEMESASLFALADEFGAQAGTVCMVTDIIMPEDKPEYHMPAEERETNLCAMMKVALNVAAEVADESGTKKRKSEDEAEPTVAAVGA